MVIAGMSRADFLDTETAEGFFIIKRIEREKIKREIFELQIHGYDPRKMQKYDSYFNPFPESREIPEDELKEMLADIEKMKQGKK